MPVLAPSFDELVALGQAEAVARRPRLGFADGDITEAQLHGSAAMADHVFGLAAKLFRDTFFDGAVGDALTALVDDHCNIQRKGATAATVNLLVLRTSFGGAGTIPAGTRFGCTKAPDGSQVTFTSNANVAVPSGQNGPFTVACTAVDTGPEGNVADDATLGWTILDTLFDATLTATQDEDAGGGNVEESDAELRQRAKTYHQTLRRGTLAALEQGALMISSVHSARAVEDPGTFLVTVVVADSDGGSSLQMVADVTAELENWRCAGAPVTVSGGTKVLVDMTIKLDVVKPGFDTTAASTDLIAAVTAKINGRRGGETVYLDTVIATVIAVAPDYIEAVSVTQLLVAGVVQNPIGDVVPATAFTTFRPGVITIQGPG